MNYRLEGLMRTSEVLLQHAEPGFQVTTPLPAAVRGWYHVDDITDDFVGGAAAACPNHRSRRWSEGYLLGCDQSTVTTI